MTLSYRAQRALAAMQNPQHEDSWFVGRCASDGQIAFNIQALGNIGWVTVTELVEGGFIKRIEPYLYRLTIEQAAELPDLGDLWVE